VTWNVEGDLAACLSDHRAMGAGWRHMPIDDDKRGSDAGLLRLAYDGPRALLSYAC